MFLATHQSSLLQAGTTKTSLRLPVVLFFFINPLCINKIIHPGSRDDVRENPHLAKNFHGTLLYGNIKAFSLLKAQSKNTL